MARRGVPLLALACALFVGLALAALVPAAGATHGTGKSSLVDARLARLVAAGELPIDAMFLPATLQGHLQGLADVDALAGTGLPGPSGRLLSLDGDGSLSGLIWAPGTLPALPAVDVQRLLAAAPWDAPGAILLSNPLGTAKDTVSGVGIDAPLFPPSASYAPPQGGVADPASDASATGTPRSGPAPRGPVALWESMTPAQKTASAAGALGLLLFLPFAMYSRIRRDEALRNPTRASIYEIVTGTPGLCIKDIAERAEVSYSTATYHLDRLVKDGYAVANDEGNKVTYYKNGGHLGPEDRTLVPLVKNPECMRVFRTVLENPWCYRAQVAELLGVSHTTVNWHLKRLTDAGLITEHREGRACHLMVPPEGLVRLEAVMDKLEARPAAPAAGLPVAV